jgi:hypothetical protein
MRLLLLLFACSTLFAQDFFTTLSVPAGLKITGTAGNSHSDLFISCSNGAVYRSTDNGGSFQPLSGIVSDYSINGVFTDRYDNIYAMSSTVVLISYDNGVTWVKRALPDGAEPPMAVSSYGAMCTSGFYGTYFGWKVFVSLDSANTWTPIYSISVNGMLLSTDGAVNIVAGGFVYNGRTGPPSIVFGGFIRIDSTVKGGSGTATGNILAAPFGSVLYQSAYYTATWTSWEQSVYVNDARWDYKKAMGSMAALGWYYSGAENSKGEFFIVNGQGTYRSLDHGITFTKLPTERLLRRIFTTANGYLYGLNMGGDTLCRSTLQTTSAGSIDRRLPEGFSLEQNYPNPFNPSTTIRYHLPEASRVTITVSDLLGREIAVLVNDQRPAGYHSLPFSGAGLSSGVYVCTINAGRFNSFIKMSLLR